MKTLITLQKYLSDHITRHREKYPDLKIFQRITSIDTYLNELNQEHCPPYMVATSAQIIDFCSAITNNIHQAQHLAALFRCTRQFMLNTKLWANDPDPMIRQQYQQLEMLDRILDKYQLAVPSSLYHHFYQSDNAYFYQTHLPLPLTKPHVTCHPVAIPSSDTKTSITYIDENINPNHLSKVIAQLGVKRCIISGSDSEKLISLSDNMPMQQCAQHPKPLAKTTWFSLWVSLWHLPSRFMTLQHLRKILLSPYITLPELEKSMINDFLHSSIYYPCTNIDIHTNTQIQPELKQFLLSHSALMHDKPINAFQWLEICHQIAQLWGIAYPEQQDSNHVQINQLWDKFTMEIQSIKSLKTHAEWSEIAKIIASQLSTSVDNSKAIRFLPIKSLPGVSEENLILLDMDDQSWLNDTVKFVVNENDQSTIKSYLRAYQVQLTETLCKTFKNIYIIVEPDKKSEKISSFSGPKRIITVGNQKKALQFSPHHLHQSSALQGNSLKKANLIIREYATCPAKGYLIQRLNIQSQEKNTSGTDPKLRGIIIHEWLANFAKFQSEAQRTNLIKEHLDHARKQGYIIPKSTQQFEIQRLLKMMLQFDALSNENPDLLKIYNHEKSISGTINGINIKARIDGMLKLDNKNIIIDYKTSMHSINACIQHPLKSPQLPLYTVLTKPHTSGICYINIDSNQANISGTTWNITHPSMKLNHIDNPLPNWQNEFSNLISIIKSGDATPQPDSPSICTQCMVANICRHKYTAS